MFIWRHGLTYFKWGLIAAVLAGVAAWLYIGQHIDDEIRRKVEDHLAKYFPDLTVSVASARLIDGEGIRVKGVRIRDDRLPGWQAELASIDEIMLSCDTSLKKLIQGDIRITAVLLRRPRLHATRLADGTWSILQLLQGRRRERIDQAVDVQIESGVLEIVDSTQSPPRRFTLREVNVELTNAVQGGANVIRVTGRLQGDHLRQVEFDGQYRPDEEVMMLNGKIDGLAVSPELIASLPKNIADRVENLKILRARVDVGFRLGFDAKRAEAWQFATTTQIHGGRIEHPSLPYPLRDLQGTVFVSNHHLKVSDFVARNRQTTLRLTAEFEGLDPGAPKVLRIQGQRMVFDRRLLDALPPKWHAIWRMFSPEGEADIDAKLTFDGKTWRPDIKLTARNVSFRYDQMPYPMHGARGILSLKDNRLSFDLTSRMRDTPVTIKGEIADLDQNASGWVEIEGKKISLDRDLIDALPPEIRSLVESFHPAGFFDLHLKMSKQPGESEFHQLMRLQFHDSYARFQGFPYPLTHLSGTIEQHDQYWSFHDITANNGSGRIACQGSLRPSGDGQELRLNITAGRIPLDEELRGALPEESRELWTRFKPQGFIDLNVSLRYLTQQRRLQLKVDVTPVGDTMSIEPLAFPYRYEKLKGKFSYQDGLVDLQNIQAEHGDTQWQAQGRFQRIPGDRWSLRLFDLNIDRLRVDRDLLRAAPPRFRQFLSDLNPTGPFNLRGEITFSHNGRRADSLRTDWDVNVFCHRNSVQAGIKLDDIFGSVRLRGSYQNGRVNAHGQLNLDSVSYRGFQFTEVSGPFKVTGDRVLFGDPNASPLQPGKRRITARCYGGTLYGDGWVLRGTPAEFFLRTNLQGGDLARFSREAIVGSQSLSGRADGWITLNRTSQGAHILQGEGYLGLRDANIYELPLMLSLLQVLTLQQPDMPAFTTCDIDFQIKGSHVYFDRIDLQGDALRLRGQGTLGFDKQLQLTFRPEVVNRKIHIPIFSDLIGGASGEILKLYVGGTLDEPDIRREPFPFVQEVIENLQSPPLFPTRTGLPNLFPKSPLMPLR